MGDAKIAPRDSSLEWDLNNWATFKGDDQKNKHHIFFCDVVWPQYKLRYGEIWPVNRYMNYNTIFQLDCYAKMKASGVKYLIFRYLWLFTKIRTWESLLGCVLPQCLCQMN